MLIDGRSILFNHPKITSALMIYQRHLWRVDGTAGSKTCSRLGTIGLWPWAVRISFGMRSLKKHTESCRTSSQRFTPLVFTQFQYQMCFDPGEKLPIWHRRHGMPNNLILCWEPPQFGTTLYHSLIVCPQTWVHTCLIIYHHLSFRPRVVCDNPGPQCCFGCLILYACDDLKQRKTCSTCFTT